MKTHRRLVLPLAAAALAIAPLLRAAAPDACPADKRSCATPKSAWNVTRHVPLADFVMQSHRGAGVLAEENTLEAFKVGWQWGTIPESDVRATKDGVIVAFHDGNFKRLVKDADAELKKKGVEKVTWKFLSTLDVGSWKGDAFKGRRVPKMSDIFAYMGGKPKLRLYLDIKKVDFEKLAAQVRAAGVQGQVIVASRKPDELITWKKLVPESGTLLWMPGDEQEITAMLDGLEKTGDMKKITQVQLHVKPNAAKDSPEPFNHTRAFIVKLGERLRAGGIVYQALPYTSDETVYATLMDLGVASFATDHPDVTVREVKAYYAKHAACASGKK